MTFTAISIELLCKSFYEPTMKPVMKNAPASIINAASVLHHFGLWCDNQITERGRIHVKALCSIPVPEQRWVSPIDEKG